MPAGNGGGFGGFFQNRKPTGKQPPPPPPVDEGGRGDAHNDNNSFQPFGAFGGGDYANNGASDDMTGDALFFDASPFSTTDAGQDDTVRTAWSGYLDSTRHSHTPRLLSLNRLFHSLLHKRAPLHS